MLDVATRQERMKFSAAAVPLSLVTLLARFLTFGTQLVIAQFFGAGIETDAYFAAESVVLLLGNLIVIGFSVAFIPQWLSYRTQSGESEANHFADAFISLATGLTVLLGLVLALGAPWIARIIAPGFSAQASGITTQLLKVMALATIFLGFTAGCTGLLEARRHFLVPAFSRVAYSAVVLTALVFLSSRFGVMALAWGAVTGSIARLLIQFVKARQFGEIHFTWGINHTRVRQTLRLIPPILIALVGTEVTLLLDSVVASLLPAGGVARLAYASRVVLLPVGILALPLRTTIFPTLSQQAAHKQFEALGETALAGVRILAFVILPVSAGILVLRHPLVNLLFERGSFDSQAAQLTASGLGWYALGVPAIGALMIISNAFFSLGDPMTIVKLNFFNWISNFLLNFALVGPMGSNGIALATSVSVTLTCVLAIFALKRRLSGIGIGSLANNLGKVLLATLVMISSLLLGGALFGDRFSHILPSLSLYSLAILVTGSVIGVAAYTLAAFVLRIDEISMVFRAISRVVPLGKKLDEN